MSVRCPKCGNSDIVGYMGEWECMDFGYKFRLSTSYIISKEVNGRAGSCH